MAEAQSSGTRAAARPLSPHLTIYRWPITMAMSIAHRVTGSALYVGMLLIAWWLIAAVSGPNAYGVFQSAAGSWIGRLVLFGYTWALLHHMLGGIRHLIWDTIHGLEPGERDWLAWSTVYGSAALTILVWLIAYFFTAGLRS
jgi:succinate dehydrogenase / fumarate reductase cytochrome b subunit